MSFPHLRVASSWSMRYGTHTPTQIVTRATELGIGTLALTDRDSLAGTVEFVRACSSAGITPIVGTEVSGVTLLGTGENGWAGLCAAVSAVHAGKPVLPIAGEHGLVVLLGPQSEVGQYIAKRRPDRALDHVNTWRESGARVYIEIVTHHEHPDGDGLSDRFAARMLQWAIAHRAPAVLTNAVRYLDSSDGRVADVLDSARQRVPLAKHRRTSSTHQAFLASSEHMSAVAQRVSAMVGDPRDIGRALLRQTHELAADMAIDPRAHMGLGGMYVPELSMLLPNEQRSSDAILRERCEQGLAEYLIREPSRRGDARERLESELGVVARMGLAGYLLTVGEVVDMVKQMHIRVAARGSGAGSFINHLLGISGVDPLAYGLLMERFVSTLRPGLPDIDIDVESARRLEIYDAIFERFGPERTTCVSMRETYRVRHAVRDVGMALGMPPGEIDTFAKSFPHIRAKYVRNALAELPEMRRTGLARMAAEGSLETFLDLVESLDGLPRGISMHPCGIVLSDRSLLRRTPVQASAQGYSMSQFDKDDVEHMGLLKLDVLGVRMQSTLAYAIAEVARVEGKHIDLERVPRDDSATFDLIRSTRTLGCFQIESPGQRELIGKFAPERFDDLIIDISLFRPGPVKSDMITPFLRARQGWAMADYIHEDVKDALEETCGVVVFHEQVMRIIATLAGVSLEQADLVRRNLGDIGQIDAHREWFYRALQARGYSLAVIEDAWSVLRAFASFGFCKAHGAAFALPTYQSAWFKAHHPAAFFAGVLTHDPGMYPKRLIVDDARGFGVPVLGVDVNKSGEHYIVEPIDGGTAVRVALSEVKGISSAEVAAVVAGQPYESLADFVARARVSLPIIENLILAGGFDAMHGEVSRRDLLWHLINLRESAAPVSGNQMVFAASRWTPTPTGLKPMSMAERVKHEVEVLGLDLSAHVISFYAPMLRDLGVLASVRMLDVRSQARVLVAGVKVATQTPPIRSGKRVAFVTLDDSTGPVDVTFFEDAQEQYAPTLFHSWLLLARGEIRRTGPRGVSVRADGCWELGAVWEVWREGGVTAVHEMLARQPYDDSEPVVATAVWEHASGFRQSPYAQAR